MYLRTISLGLLAVLCAASPFPTLLAQTPPGSPLANEQTVAPSNPQDRTDRSSRIESLITQLGSHQFAERDAARRELTAMGRLAHSALERARDNNPNMEIVSRALRLLALVPEATHRVVDVFGDPIPGAIVTVKIVHPEKIALRVEQVIPEGSDDQGGIAIPDVTPEQWAVVELMHPDYGGGRFELSTVRRIGDTRLRFPLVKKGSEARGRAVTGIVVDESGEPIEGAFVQGRSARTPGEGLINGEGTYGDAMTDEQGRFVFYLPNKDHRGERGELIPANTNYQLSIGVAGDQSYFPHVGSHSNLKTSTITLRRAKRFHRFRFEAVDGGWIEDPRLLGAVRVLYEGDPASGQRSIPLEQRVIQAGRMLVPGRYRASGYFNGSELNYLPVEVTAESPKTLEFKVPPPRVYRGRVVNGVTGQPLAGAMVMGNSSSPGNFALLPPDTWRQLRANAERADFDPRTDSSMRQYGMQALVRAGEDGRFEITQAPDREFYGLIAMDENYVPFNVRIFSLKTDVEGPIEAGDFFLFPAAKVMVRPVHEGEHLSVSPKWLVEPSGQPDWFNRFQTATDGQNREFEYVHWLQNNEPQPLFVPAGVRLRMMLESPYDDAWAPAVIEEPIQLAPGQTSEIGDVHFAAAFPAVVRVVDQNGQPLEGIPVHRRYDDGMGSVVHNTNAKGEAKLYVNPDSRGRFYIYDGLPGTADPFASFDVANAAPSKPFVISLTDEQRRLIMETPPRAH